MKPAWAMVVLITQRQYCLRWMAENLDLGYDLFDAVMLPREVQAENMAKRLMDLACESLTWHFVTGHHYNCRKRYKPEPYETGSAVCL